MFLCLSEPTAPSDVKITSTDEPGATLISWTAPEGVKVDTYTIGYKTDPGGSYSYVSTPDSATQYTLRLQYVEPGHYLAASVQAVCQGQGDGNWSPEADNAPPRTPSKQRHVS